MVMRDMYVYEHMASLQVSLYRSTIKNYNVLETSYATKNKKYLKEISLCCWRV